MESTLHDRILTRLLDDEALGALAVDLVDAACHGSARLEQVLAGTRFERPPAPVTPASGEWREPPGVYIDAITVAGFRGAGPEVTLSIPPGPGLTLVVGRNGSGKSTFAEALETLLTGESGRWSAARSKLWKQGWRNLHAGEAPRVQATLVVEGQAPIRITRRWSSAELSEAAVDVEGAESLDALGWTSALTAFRPFISHPELGVLAAEPSQAFDQLHEVLGLGEVTSAVSLLAAQRKTLDGRAKAVKERRSGLVAQARELAASDPRIERILELLGHRKLVLDELEAEVLGESEESGADSEHAVLRALSSLRVPVLEEWTTAAASLRQAAQELAAAGADAAADHSALARALDAVLPLLTEQPERCPVCEQPVPGDLAVRLAERVQRARELSARFERCQQAMTFARRGARALLERVPEGDLAAAERLGLTDGLVMKLTAVRDTRQENARSLAEQLEELGADALATVERVRGAAVARLRALDDTFKPFRREVIAWLRDARQEELAAPRLKAMKAAEKWLQGQEQALRAERFAPLAEQVRDIWALLGQRSSVALDSVQLVGKGVRRRLELGVSVDGSTAAALGVMSQGELNALTLSLFLPRMMLTESPFRFLVIDDPVQAMDPVKVDGLARALQRAAEKRQVLVFTHDPRLTEAVQRLQIPATVQEVTRRARSSIEVRVVGDATSQYLSDARHVAHTANAMGDELVRRVVPGFCRSALEAACLSVVRRRRLGRGDDHEEVERALGSSKLFDLMSLALFDTAERAGDVLGQLNRSAPRGSANAVQAVKAGAHGQYAGDPLDLVRDVERLTTYLVAQA